MGHVEDRWYKTVKGTNGKPKRVACQCSRNFDPAGSTGVRKELGEPL